MSEQKLRQQLDQAWQLNRREENLSADWSMTRDCLAPSPHLLARIAAAYRGATPQAAGDSMWTGFMRENLAVHEALIANDCEALARVFADPGKTNVFKGFDNLFSDVSALLDVDLSSREHLARLNHDLLLQLVEAIGLRRVFNPEQPFSPFNGAPDVEEVLSELDARVGFEVAFPSPYPGECGLATSRGVVTYRAVHALYQAWLTAESLGHRADKRVLEIGAGLGRTAYYARQFGLRDYTIVDLPFTNASQAHFLGTVLGGDGVCLQGEAARPDAVKIVTGEAFLASDERYDLVVNVDSFTEIDPAIARSYWAAIEGRAPRILSINHECNHFTMTDLIRRSPQIRRASRVPYWLRRGYLQQVVDFGPDSQHQKLLALECTVAALRASTSWRVTEPLRRISDALRKLTR